MMDEPLSLSVMAKHFIAVARDSGLLAVFSEVVRLISGLAMFNMASSTLLFIPIKVVMPVTSLTFLDNVCKV